MSTVEESCDQSSAVNTCSNPGGAAVKSKRKSTSRLNNSEPTNASDLTSECATESVTPHCLSLFFALSLSLSLSLSYRCPTFLLQTIEDQESVLLKYLLVSPPGGSRPTPPARQQSLEPPAPPSGCFFQCFVGKAQAEKERKKHTPAHTPIASECPPYDAGTRPEDQAPRTALTYTDDSRQQLLLQELFRIERERSRRRAKRRNAAEVWIHSLIDGYFVYRRRRRLRLAVLPNRLLPSRLLQPRLRRHRRHPLCCQQRHHRRRSLPVRVRQRSSQSPACLRHRRGRRRARQVR